MTIEIDDTPGQEIDRQYRYGEPWQDGPQKAVILWAEEHRSKSGRASLKVTLGLAPHAPGAPGAKCDAYVPLGMGALDRADRAAFVRCVVPEQAGQRFLLDPTDLPGLVIDVGIVTEEGGGVYPDKPGLGKLPPDSANDRYRDLRGVHGGWLSPGSVSVVPAVPAAPPVTNDPPVDDWGAGW